MYFAITTYGSRGDVQPFVSLALGLMDKGHRVTLLAPENFKEFVNSSQFEKIDLVVEAASINAASSYVVDILKKGKDIMIMSIGVFADYNFYKDIIQFLKIESSNVFLPSGAIGGIDIIRSIKNYIERDSRKGRSLQSK